MGAGRLSRGESVHHKVFYLDDEIELLELFRDLFESGGFEIETFSHPNELIARTQEATPQLIFLDYRLPGTNGIEVAKLLPPHIPKVLITGELDVETERLFVRKFAKPYNVSEVQEFIQTQLGAH